MHIRCNRLENLTFRCTGRRHKRQQIGPFGAELRPGSHGEEKLASFISGGLTVRPEGFPVFGDCKMIHRLYRRVINNPKSLCRRGAGPSRYLKALCAFLPLCPSSSSHSHSPVSLSQTAVYTARTAGEEVHTAFSAWPAESLLLAGHLCRRAAARANTSSG